VFVPDYLSADGFHKDPLRVREVALSLEFKKDFSSGLPCRSSYAKQTSIPHSLNKFSKLLNSKISYSRPQGKFCLLLKHDFEKAPYALQHSKKGYLGIVYLNLPDQCKGQWGGVVLRHIDTELKTTADRDKINKLLKKRKISKEKLIDDLENDWSDLSRWKELYKVQVAFNRLFLIKREFFYREMGAFGSHKRNGKLFQMFEFDIVKGTNYEDGPPSLNVFKVVE
jgi:hypothetical protein